MNLKAVFTSSFFLKKIFLGALFVLIFISAITYRHTIVLSESTNAVLHSHQVRLELEQLISYLKDAETGDRGYLITHDPIFLQPYKGSVEKVKESYSKLKRLTSDNLKQQNNLDSLDKLIHRKYSCFIVSQQINSKAFVNQDKLSEALLTGKVVMDKIRLKVNEMVDLEMIYLKERQSAYDDEISFTPIFTLLLFLFTVSIFVISYLMINRDLATLTKSNEVLLITTEAINQAEEIGNTSSWQWDLESGTFIYSDNLFRLLACNPQSFSSTSTNFIDFVHPEDRHILLDGISKVINENKTSNHFFRVIRRDGELRYFMSSSKILSDINKRKIVIGVTSDVTKQHLNNLELEKRNQELEKRNKELIIKNESINHAEVIGNFSLTQWDLKTKELAFSDNLYRILGCEPQSFVPTVENFLKFVHPDDVYIIANGIEDILDKNKTYLRSYRIVREDGEIRFLNSIGKIIDDGKNQKIQIGVISDVTDQFLNNVELEDRNHELEQSNNELASFNYVASHDLQEPLRKIQLFISRIEDSEKQRLSEVGIEYFLRINQSALRMRTLIDDLLMFSRTNKADKTFERMDLTAIFQKAKLELAEAIEDKNALIESTRLPILQVIPYQIQQLFINLISNSLKYSKANITPIIKIECEKVRAKEYEIITKANGEKKYYKFTFTDNGLGFEQAQAENIFILFNRLHHKTEYTGTGIGLAICKKIVENHGGFIMAKGVLDEGATFVFFLPE